MNILLIGYGKMGKAIEQLATQRGHVILYIIEQDNLDLLTSIDAHQVDVAIEFSEPGSAYGNIYQCIKQGIPVVSGTTGWLQQKPAIEAYCKEQNGTFFYASNFSVGAHIFFKLNEVLAKLMQQQEYEVSLEEIHHTTKKDQPSGTAIRLAEDIIQNIPKKKQWVNAPSQAQDQLSIISKRIPEVAGTHTISYDSAIDCITIQHKAHNRMGFALGAILAAEWVKDKKGIFGMQDLLPYNENQLTDL